MKTENTARESQRVSELAADYRKKGYSVIEPRHASQIPEFMRDLGYLPDLLATSPKESLVVEVKSRETASDLTRLSRIAERVNAEPGWQFVLVFTNPREQTSEATTPRRDKVQELLLKSRTLGLATPAHVEASFLFAWVAFESSLRLLPAGKRGARAISTPWTLVRDAATDGLLARRDARDIERMLKMRNAILHGGDLASPTSADVASLQDLTTEILQASVANEA